MSLSELKALLDQVADTRELVLRRSCVHDPIWNEAYLAWSDAHDEAEEAYAAWQRDGGEPAYRRLPRRAGPRGRRAGRAVGVHAPRADQSRREVVRAAPSGVSCVVREADPLAPRAVDQHHVGGVVELAASAARSPNARQTGASSRAAAEQELHRGRSCAAR